MKQFCKIPLMSLILTMLSVLFLIGCTPNTAGANDVAGGEIYSPQISPSDFVPEIDSPYFTLTPGAKFTYEGETGDGTEKIVTIVTDKTRVVAGITAIEIWDRVWMDNELIEETLDWYAQDKEGNVWYLGEDSKEYENGDVVGTAGSWESGVDGAKPGIIMKANPQVGDSYRQEYYKGEAEDMADIISLDETVVVPFGSFSNCLKTRDWSQIDPDLKEYKYYCKEVGGMTLEVNIETGERVELIKVE